VNIGWLLALGSAGVLFVPSLGFTKLYRETVSQGCDWMLDYAKKGGYFLYSYGRGELPAATLSG
jgi:hypothetical protein